MGRRGFRGHRQCLPAGGYSRLRERRPLRFVGGKFRPVKTRAAKLPGGRRLTGMNSGFFLSLEKCFFRPRGKNPVGGRLARRGDNPCHQQKNCETVRPEWCWQWHDAVN